jgi:hypothetical protein
MYGNVIVGGPVDVVVWLVKVFEVAVGFVSVLGASPLLGGVLLFGGIPFSGGVVDFGGVLDLVVYQEGLQKWQSFLQYNILLPHFIQTLQGNLYHVNRITIMKVSIRQESHAT